MGQQAKEGFRPKAEAENLTDQTAQSRPIDASDKTNDLERELDETQKQLSGQRSKYLYLYADFENFKKSVVRERAELIKFG